MRLKYRIHRTSRVADELGVKHGKHKTPRLKYLVVFTFTTVQSVKIMKSGNTGRQMQESMAKVLNKVARGSLKAESADTLSKRKVAKQNRNISERKSNI